MVQLFVNHLTYTMARRWLFTRCYPWQDVGVSTIGCGGCPFAFAPGLSLPSPTRKIGRRGVWNAVPSRYYLFKLYFFYFSFSPRVVVVVLVVFFFFFCTRGKAESATMHHRGHFAVAVFAHASQRR